MAIRLALGASRFRIVRQLLAESLLLSASAAAIGVLFAFWGVNALGVVVPETIGIPRELEPAMSVLAGRMAEGVGRPQDALRAYAASIDSLDRPSAAQAR